MESIFRQTCFNHFFELKVAELHRQGKITCPMYLSLGTEHIPATIATTGDWVVFPQHRCHSVYLSFGGDPAKLLKELLGSPDGCNGGYGGSASISVPGKVFGHDGLLGSNHAIAAGYCHGSGKPTIAFMGDAAVEECYVLSSLGYTVTKNIPLLTIVEDNGLSILTKTEVRRSWSIVEVAKGFGMSAVDIDDDPETIYNTVCNIKLPALVNIKVCRVMWHAGSGQDNLPEWDRFSMFSDKMNNKQIEEEAKELVEKYEKR